MKSKIFKRNKIKNGFVILYTMILASIILAIAMGILRIALKEANFSVSARAGNEAFFAADTGAECALYYDQTANSGVPNAFDATNPGQITCAGNNNTQVGFNGSNFYFKITGLAESENACASVTLTRDSTSNTTTIISTGYNNCYTNSGVAVRELKVTY